MTVTKHPGTAFYTASDLPAACRIMGLLSAPMNLPRPDLSSQRAQCQRSSSMKTAKSIQEVNGTRQVLPTNLPSSVLYDICRKIDLYAARHACSN